MGKKCGFAHCPNQQSKKKEGKHHVQFHSFPLNRPHVTIKWLEAMREDKWAPTAASRLCSEHFTDDCYKPTTGPRKLLRPNAIPSIFYFPGKSFSRKLSAKSSRNVKEKPQSPVREEQYHSTEEQHPEEQLPEEHLPEDHEVNFVNVTKDLDESRLEDSSCYNKTVTHDLLIINEDDEGDLNFHIEYIDNSDSKDVENLENDLDLDEDLMADDVPEESSDQFEQEEIPPIEAPPKMTKFSKLQRTFDAYENRRRASLNQQKLLRRNIKVLKLRIKRRDKRIQQLRTLVNELRAKVEGFPKGEELTSGLEGFLKDLLKHAIRNRDAKRNAIRYSPHMKEFALTLYSLSSKAYDYVRSLILYLPNPSLIKKWISSLNKPQLIERNPETQLIDNIEIISDIREELIIGSISDLIEIDARNANEDSFQ